ncbi:MAG: GTPase domain-containing protein, partial [Candidatus Korarchaeota archaeon]|nr:GTPase domain-containing protein [Candidatus Korarchaeota archaeon]NIU84190.1 hypothetical protein [Candidatus Thorarchaeota archaeon]NIW14338.1 hypothetical protein [Candidatus Thorarchaeota archaeon]NIW52427.1 hypothetical protein [Candidatus Korarchaeota archaeon]
MESEPSRVRVALYGPTETGKSTYKAVLLGKNPNTVKTPTETIETVERVRKFREMRRGELRPLEQYKLLLTDLSGLEDFRDERLKAIAAGVVGCLFFYDATDPSSAEQLVQMVEEELLKTEYIERFLGIAILGNKISEDLSPEAVRKVEKLKDHLDSIITPVWGYETPHLLISSVKKNDVVLSFWVLESILSSKEVPEQPLAKYS